MGLNRSIVAALALALALVIGAVPQCAVAATKATISTGTNAARSPAPSRRRAVAVRTRGVSDAVAGVIALVAVIVGLLAGRLVYRRSAAAAAAAARAAPSARAPAPRDGPVRGPAADPIPRPSADPLPGPNLEFASDGGRERPAGSKAPPVAEEGELDAIALVRRVIELAYVIADDEVSARLETALRDAGLVRVDPVGEIFDPDEHAAVGRRESTVEVPGRIARVLRPGWRLDDRLIQPAEVVVFERPDE